MEAGRKAMCRFVLKPGPHPLKGQVLQHLELLQDVQAVHTEAVREVRVKVVQGVQVEALEVP